MSPTLLRWLPLPLLAAGALLSWILATGHAPPAAESIPPPRPVVEVVTATPRDVQLHVRTHGSVEPRSEIDLVAEVAGRVESVSPRLEDGAFFSAGEVLVEIEREDAALSLRRAEASVLRAQSELGLARARFERLEALAEHAISSAAQLEEAEYVRQGALARLRETRAIRDQARRDLKRTRIRAPFDGRVRERRVDVGHFASRGTPLARICSSRSVTACRSGPQPLIAIRNLLALLAPRFSFRWFLLMSRIRTPDN